MAEPTLEAAEFESGEPTWPRLAAGFMADVYGVEQTEDMSPHYAAWCVFDPDEDNPPIAEGIVTPEFAEELVRRWNEHDGLLATLAEKDRRIGELEAEVATAYHDAQLDGAIDRLHRLAEGGDT